MIRLAITRQRAIRSNLSSLLLQNGRTLGVSAYGLFQPSGPSSQGTVHRPAFERYLTGRRDCTYEQRRSYIFLPSSFSEACQCFYDAVSRSLSKQQQRSSGPKRMIRLRNTRDQIRAELLRIADRANQGSSRHPATVPPHVHRTKGGRSKRYRQKLSLLHAEWKLRKNRRLTSMRLSLSNSRFKLRRNYARNRALLLERVLDARVSWNSRWGRLRARTKLPVRLKAKLATALRKTRRRLANTLFYHSITLTEPAEKEWFDFRTGYPLTSRNKWGRFVNPWNSESTNGDHGLSLYLRWKLNSVWSLLSTALFYGTGLLGSSVTVGQDLVTATPPIKRRNPKEEAMPKNDKIKLTWVGHSTLLVRMSDSFTLLTDPVFSHKVGPTSWFGEMRYTPPALDVNDLSSMLPGKNGVDVCMISHDHYDHLDYASIMDLVEHGLVRYWVVPLGLKLWLMEEAGIDGKDIVELEWWESVKFCKSRRNCNEEGYLEDVEIVELLREFDTLSSRADAPNERIDEHTSIHGEVERSKSKTVHDEVEDAHEMVITCAPAQHWGSRTPFDRNKRLWCSWTVHTTSPSDASTFDEIESAPSAVNKNGSERVMRQQHRNFPLLSQIPTNVNHLKKRLSFFFAGDTGLPSTFPLHRQIGDRLGPFDLAALPIGAYAPRFFMQDSHCDPYEAARIHRDLQSRRSVAIHWGTFSLTDEPHDEPPRLLRDAIIRAQADIKKAKVRNDSTNGNGVVLEEEDPNEIDFVTIGHGEWVESPLQVKRLEPRTEIVSIAEALEEAFEFITHYEDDVVNQKATSS